MSPVGNSSLVKEGRYHIVTWDLDTTGRRLIDEICQVAGFYKNGSEEFTYSQYVMPHKNPNPGARRSFGIKVTSMGRYRMLKDVETGRIYEKQQHSFGLFAFLKCHPSIFFLIRQVPSESKILKFEWNDCARARLRM